MGTWDLSICLNPYLATSNLFQLLWLKPLCNFDNNFLQMTPMADYFLQNRPMMVGLPAVILVILFLFDSQIFMAGILTALLIKFQLFGFMISWIFFGTYFGLKLLCKKINFKKFLKYLSIFLLPTLLFGLFFVGSKVGSRSLLQVFWDSFSWGPWQKHGALWFIYFLLGNFGIGFLIYLLGIFFKKTWKSFEVSAIYITSFILLIIPILMRFTIYEFDMLKFYYYLIPLICVLVAYFYSSSKYKKLAVIFFIIITIISSLTSINLLFNSYLNKNEGYSYADFEVGSWIRNNIPQKAIFVTMPTVHSAPTDIAGRLRIISYINWPYSHGFNVGSDNVFSRVDDVTRVYTTGEIGQVRLKYGARYIFYGEDERGQFPNARKLFDKNESLKLIYNKDEILIYAIL